MAKQSGIILLEGALDNISFVKTQDGFIAKKKTVIPKDKIQTDPSFQRTRENMSEFGAATKAGKVVRDAFTSILKNTKDNRVVSRLAKDMHTILKGDTGNVRGQRKVSAGSLDLLKGFDFNTNAKLSSTLHAAYTPNIDRAAGNLKVFIPSFAPADMIVAPQGTTHFKIVSGGAEFDFDNLRYTVDVQESGILPWDNNPTALINLTNSVTANSRLPLMLVLGVQFYQQVNGIAYPLSNGGFNALSVVGVDKP
jgi:hypothetical protein